MGMGGRMGGVGGGWEERGWAGSLWQLTEDRLPPESSPAQRAPWCRPHGVVVSTPGEAVGAWHVEPKTPGRSHHCRHPGSTAVSLACPELQGGSAVVDSWATHRLSLTRPAGSPEGGEGQGGGGSLYPRLRWRGLGSRGPGEGAVGDRGEVLTSSAPPPEIREAFKVFDRDGNGFISKQELGTAMRSLGYMPNEVELEVIIQRLDMDGEPRPCLFPQPSPAGATGEPSLDPEPPGLSPQGSFHSQLWVSPKPVAVCSRVWPHFSAGRLRPDRV